MTVLRLDDPAIEQMSLEWGDFMEKVYPDLPDNATAINIGAIFLFLLREYNPPLEEIVAVLEKVLAYYINGIPTDKQRMN